MKKQDLFALCTTAALLGFGSSGWAADAPAAAAPAAGAHDMHDMRGLRRDAAVAGPKAAPTDAELIASAMKAAPRKLGDGATIVAPGDNGAMRTLRPGNNGFTCMPDNPGTPGPDPMCWDKNADAWINAYMGHKTPPAGKVGLMYMLAGGTDASNTDPYAAKPTTANHWIKTGPHVMIVGADGGFYDTYPKGADPDTSVPYVMWAGTPYQHLMAPIR